MITNWNKSKILKISQICEQIHGEDVHLRTPEEGHVAGVLNWPEQQLGEFASEIINFRKL